MICSHVDRTELDPVNSLISEANIFQNCSFIREKYDQDILYTCIRLSKIKEILKNLFAANEP